MKSTFEKALTNITKNKSRKIAKKKTLCPALSIWVVLIFAENYKMQKNPVDLVDEVSLLLCILLKPMKPLPQTILTCHWTPTGTTIDFHPGSLITVRIYTNFISCDAAKCHILEGEVGPSPRISQNRRDWQLNCVFFSDIFQLCYKRTVRCPFREKKHK